MPWWMKQILLFHSLFLFLSCSDSPAKEETVEPEPDVVEELFNELENWHEKDFKFRVDSLIAAINDANKGIKAYSFENPIDPNKLVFTAPSDSLFAAFTARAHRLSDDFYEQEEYKVWRSTIKDKKLLEISLFPHPTEGFVFMFRARAQE